MHSRFRAVFESIIKCEHSVELICYMLCLQLILHEYAGARHVNGVASSANAAAGFDCMGSFVVRRDPWCTSTGYSIVCYSCHHLGSGVLGISKGCTGLVYLSMSVTYREIIDTFTSS